MKTIKINYSNNSFEIKQHSFNNKPYFSIKFLNIQSPLEMFFSFKEEKLDDKSFPECITNDTSNIEYYVSQFINFISKANYVKKTIQSQETVINTETFDFVFKHGLYSSSLSYFLSTSFLDYTKIQNFCFQSRYCFYYFFVFYFSKQNFIESLLTKNFENNVNHFLNFIYNCLYSTSSMHDVLITYQHNKNYIQNLKFLFKNSNTHFYNLFLCIDSPNMNFYQLLDVYFKKYKKIDNFSYSFFSTFSDFNIYDSIFKYFNKNKLQELFFNNGLFKSNLSEEEYINVYLKFDFSDYINKQKTKNSFIITAINSFFYQTQNFTINDDLKYKFFEHLFSKISREEYEKIIKYPDTQSLISYYPSLALCFDRIVVNYELNSF